MKTSMSHSSSRLGWKHHLPGKLQYGVPWKWYFLPCTGNPPVLVMLDMEWCCVPLTSISSHTQETELPQENFPETFSESPSALPSSLGAILSLQHTKLHSPAEASWGLQIWPWHPPHCLTAIWKWHQRSEGWWDDTQTIVGMTESAPSHYRLPRPSKYLALPDISLCSIWYLHFASLNFN